MFKSCTRYESWVPCGRLCSHPRGPPRCLPGGRPPGTPGSSAFPHPPAPGASPLSPLWGFAPIPPLGLRPLPPFGACSLPSGVGAACGNRQTGVEDRVEGAGSSLLSAGMSNWEPVDGPSSLGLSRNDGAFRIVLQRPDVLNALDTAASQALLGVLREIADDDSVRSVLITGAGRAFSAGADIGNQFGDDEARSVIERDMREITNPTIIALRELRKPVVAAVNGPA